MEFTKARLSDSMYCPLGPGSDEEVREGTPNIGAYHCPNPMDYVIQGGTHGGWDRKKAGFASASFELPLQSISLPQGAKREFLPITQDVGEQVSNPTHPLHDPFQL
jgi:hypothetical protein